MSIRPKNIVVEPILVTDLSQQLKKQRDFLRWMNRRYLSSNPAQAEAFAKGAEMFEEVRKDLLAGLFNAGEVKELFTEELPDVLELELPAETRTLLESIAAGEALVADDLAARAVELGLKVIQDEKDRQARQIAYLEARSRNAGKPGYTDGGDKQCADAFCDYRAGHGGHHSND